MYWGASLAGAAGITSLGAKDHSRFTGEVSGFHRLASVVAVTTLLMAGVSVCKLIPKKSCF